MHKYPDLNYSVNYDLQNQDWKILVTADEFFERSSKSKGKKTGEFYWAGGRMLPKSELTDKDKYWILQYNYQNTLRDPKSYTQEEIQKITSFGSSDNRKNSSGTPMFFFDFLYSAQSQKIIEEHIIKINFLGKKTRIHERIYTPIKNVEKEICKVAEIPLESLSSQAKINKINSKEPGLSSDARQARDFLINLKSTDAYHWREIKGTGRKSFHSYGIAVDLLPRRLRGKAVFWSWEKDRLGDDWVKTPLEKRWMPPESIIKIFEKYGFIWGGYWIIFDNMHFEYHPELTKSRQNEY